jgi:GT2 family glycosyltransferase
VVLTGDIEPDMLRECLASAIASSQAGGVVAEIILVDDASHTRVCDWVAQEFPSIVVLRFESPVGFSTGNNAGYRISKGRYLLQLNNDTVVHATALRRMVDFLDAHPEAGALGPRLENPDGTLQTGYYARAFPTLAYDALHLFWIHRLLPNNASIRYQMLLDQSDVTREVDQPAGASLFYRRDVLFSLDLLDEDYTFAFDDVDVCSRIKQAGWKIYYVAEAEVTHYGGVSLSKSTADMTDYYLNGLLTFYQKNRSPATFLAMRFIVIAAICFRIPVIFVAAYTFQKKQWRGNIVRYVRYLAIVLRSLVKGYHPQRFPSAVPIRINQADATSL